MSQQRTFLGHPIGLYVLFFTEMWERFSYYGMRALLVLYMVNHFRWESKDASTVYKVYTSFVYLTPILGGFLADRFLGNRRAVIIGAVLMAIGHFLMAFEAIQIFYSALVFLILGNGFFKPNMSTQVGRLYPTNDGRRDGAYTIFYMGINLGAFMSPLVCGWLAENTIGGYHSGFAVAGIGMVIGLVIYIVGQPWILEIADEKSVVAVESSTAPATPTGPAASVGAISEEEAARTPSVLGPIYPVVPAILGVLGAVALVATPIAFIGGRLDRWDAIIAAIGGICLMLMAYVTSQIRNGVRDRVVTILVLGVFTIFFWGAFEQAGNVQNLWADQSTNRYLTKMPSVQEVAKVEEKEQTPADAAKEEEKPGTAPAPASNFFTMFQMKPRPVAKAGAKAEQPGTLLDAFNPIPTAWFQSINALGIFLIAPLFAAMWIALDRRGWQPSISLKMTFGLLLMSASMFVMVGAAKAENQYTAVAYDVEKLPEGIAVDAKGILGLQEGQHFKAFHAGRLSYDAAKHEFQLWGVLPETEQERIAELTAPKSLKLDPKLPEAEQRQARLAAADPKFKAAMATLHKESNVFRVSSWWLFWSYILATLGELCLSPVGLSMVSKLAPVKYATMLMGMWMLTSAFGNFAAGLLGETWGTVPPIQFFWLITGVVAAAAGVLFALVHVLTKAMHGVN